MLLDRECIIFDLDGTLVDSLGIWSQVDQALVSRFSTMHAEISEETAYALRIDAMRRFGEGSDMYFKFCGELKKRFDIPGTAEEIHAKRCAIAQEFLRTRATYRPHAPEVLHALKKTGMKLAVVTTTRRRNISTYMNDNVSMCESAPMGEIFDAIVTRDDVAKVKPDPEGFVKAAEALGVNPKATLVIEDAAPGMIGARAAGMDAAVITEKHSADAETRAALDALAVCRFESHADILVMLARERCEMKDKKSEFSNEFIAHRR